MIRLSTAGLLHIRKRKLLLAFSRNKQCFYLPGGKVDAGETSAAALCREIREELSVSIQPEQLIYYTHITAPAYGEMEGVIMEQDCYFADIQTIPEASAEIDKLHYFSVADYQYEINKAPGAVMILEKLQADSLID
jgi:8-oxo-dGTP pyrophosphatase MutT (NUDIX family)